MSGSWAVKVAVRRLATPMSAIHGRTATTTRHGQAPEGVAQQQAERPAHHRTHQVDEQGLGRAHGQVGLVEQALHDLEHAPARRHLGHRRHGALEERRLDQLGLPPARPRLR